MSIHFAMATQAEEILANNSWSSHAQSLRSRNIEQESILNKQERRR